MSHAAIRLSGASAWLGLGVALYAASASAQGAAALLGDWLLTLEERNAVHTGALTFEGEGGAIAAFVDGGPAELELAGGTIELNFDTRDGGGQLLQYALRGRIAGDRLEGELTPPLDAPQGRWYAQRQVESAPASPQPVDFTGVWSRSSSGLARVTLDYTPAGQTAVDAYHYLDDPALRCASPGLVRVSGWPYPLEIVQNENQVTILYESFHEVRRIFLDGRGYPDKLPHRSMGYSVGHWDGSTLVVETKMLTPSHVDLAGQPLSQNARVVERMSLHEGGRVLRSELTVYDPENYRRPITRHRAWRNTPETTILEYDCDPYPFFRGLQIEGKLEEYWDRMRRRR